MIKGFIVKNWKAKLIRFPIEDSYSINHNKNIIAVADGVTRDCINNKFADKRIRGAHNLIFNYPKLSPAKKAADLFCETFPRILNYFYYKDKRAIREAFEESNYQIRKWNLENIPNPNYLNNDLAGCVATGIIEKQGIISFGYIADCGIAIFDKKGNLKFKTPNEGPNSKGSIDEDIRKKYNTSFAKEKGRKIIRKEYRNNPSQPFAYGVLTGEKEATQYIKTGEQELEPTDYLLVYSDGIESIIFEKHGDVNGNFSDKLKKRDTQGLERLCQKKVKTEGTLVYKVPEEN